MGKTNRPNSPKSGKAKGTSAAERRVGGKRAAPGQNDKSIETTIQLHTLAARAGRMERRGGAGALGGRGGGGRGTRAKVGKGNAWAALERREPCNDAIHTPPLSDSLSGTCAGNAAAAHEMATAHGVAAAHGIATTWDRHNPRDRHNPSRRLHQHKGSPPHMALVHRTIATHEIAAKHRSPPVGSPQLIGSLQPMSCKAADKAGPRNRRKLESSLQIAPK